MCRAFSRSEQRFNVPYVTRENRDGVYDSLRVITNRRRITRDSSEVLGRGYDRGILSPGEGPDGQWMWSPDGRALEVRIPWMLLNFTDPSQRRILQGPSQDPLQVPGVELSTAVVDGIGVVLGVRGPDGGWRNWPESGEASDVAQFTWPAWDEPAWEARRRPVFGVLQETFRELGAPAPLIIGPETTVGERANEAWNRGDTDTAAQLYEAILALDPSDSRALHRLALVHAWQDEHSEALALLDRLLELEPGNLEAEVDRARVFAWQGGLVEAIGTLDRILTAHPDYTPAAEARAQFQSWAGEYTASLSAYDQLVAISRDPTEIMLAQARVLGWASRIEESQAVYDSLLALNPRNLEARLGEARLLTYSDKSDEAVSRYTAILADHQGNREARQGLARALTWGGNLPKGEEAWRSSVDASPRDLVSRIGLAQNLLWQGRNAAAMDVLQDADPDQKENPDFVEQLRGVRAALAPRFGISMVQEEDSDDNIMRTAQLTGGWNPLPRLALTTEAYTKDLEQSAMGLSRSSWGMNLQASYQLEPGWVLNAGAGGTRTAGAAEASTFLKAGVVSPGRYPVGGGISASRYPLDATAQLVEQGIRVSTGEVTGRWSQGPGWQLSGSAGVGTFSGNEENQRLHANARVSRRLGGGLTVGLSHRYFGFDKNLDEFYFDPDYFGLSELMGRWAWQPGRVGFLLEAAPGLQKIQTDGEYRGALRASARLSFRFGPGQEVSLSGGYSSAGLQSFSSADSDYQYTALILGGSWVF